MSRRERLISRPPKTGTGGLALRRRALRLLPNKPLHAPDAPPCMPGDFISVSATLAVRRAEVQVMDGGKDIPVCAPDHGCSL